MFPDSPEEDDRPGTGLPTLVDTVDRDVSDAADSIEFTDGLRGGSEGASC